MFAVTVMANFDFAVMRLLGDYLKIHSVELFLVDVHHSFFSSPLYSSMLKSLIFHMKKISFINVVFLFVDALLFRQILSNHHRIE